MITRAKLILVRHGETEGNVAKILDTAVPGLPLTERGVAQAKTFGAGLARAPQVLVSSDALRARQTASYIEEATGTPAYVLDGLYEVQVGDLHGRSDREAHELFQQIYRGWHLGELDAHAPGGETGHEVLARILPVLAGLREEFLTDDADGDVVVVNHGAAMRLIGKALAGVAPPFTTNNHLDNTETIDLLPTGDGGWECLRWGKFTPPFTVQAESTADDPMS